MATVVEVASPHRGAPDSAPRRILQAVPSVELELASVVPIGDRAVPYVWARGERLREFERVVGGTEGIDEVERLDTVEGGALYRVDWAMDNPLVACVQRSNGTLLDAHGSAERIDLTVLFEAGRDASRFRQRCREAGVPLEIERLRSTVDVRRDGASGVTEAQREALSIAYEAGYFEHPRRVTQEELASRLDISAAAVGSRIRRGTANILAREFPQ